MNVQSYESRDLNIRLQSWCFEIGRQQNICIPHASPECFCFFLGCVLGGSVVFTNICNNAMFLRQSRGKDVKYKIKNML